MAVIVGVRTGHPSPRRCGGRAQATLRPKTIWRNTGLFRNLDSDMISTSRNSRVPPAHDIYLPSSRGFSRFLSLRLLELFIAASSICWPSAPSFGCLFARCYDCEFCVFCILLSSEFISPLLGFHHLRVLCAGFGFIITKADIFPVVAARGAGQVALVRLFYLIYVPPIVISLYLTIA